MITDLLCSINRYRMNRFIFILIASLFFITNGCDSDRNPVTPIVKSIEEVYLEAVHDAMIAEESEISSNLIAIKPENSYLNWNNGYVLVVTWTKYSSSYPVNDTVFTWWGETWVTVAPELKDWYKINRVSKEKITLRTEQLLGLPMNSGNTSFVEMWVKPDDLLRPAYDNEINDNTCGLFFPGTISESYTSWFNNNIIYSYYAQNDNEKYPWTRLGYTYDWGNNENKIGLSEFIIKKDAHVIIKSVTSNEEYIL